MEVISYIVDTHIVNHYENTIPNMVLFFLVGVYIDRKLSTAMSLTVASILFGQPMFIGFVTWVIWNLCF